MSGACARVILAHFDSRKVYVTDKELRSRVEAAKLAGKLFLHNFVCLTRWFTGGTGGNSSFTGGKNNSVILIIYYNLIFTSENSSFTGGKNVSLILLTTQSESKFSTGGTGGNSSFIGGKKNP